MKKLSQIINESTNWKPVPPDPKQAKQADKEFNEAIKKATKLYKAIGDGLDEMVGLREPGSWKYTGRGAELNDIVNYLTEAARLMPGSKLP
jgi:hypothetical protein